MKIKTIIILLTIVLITFLIYIFNKDEKIYVLSLGKNESNSSYIDALKQKLKENNLLEQNINITKDLNQILEDINQNKTVIHENIIHLSGERVHAHRTESKII